jgi:glycosyltransferase involved in cell wall biosynthesis
MDGIEPPYISEHNRVKICYLADADSIHTQRWVKYFAGRGHEVHLISPEQFQDGDIERVELYVLKSFPLRIRILSALMNLLLYVIQIKRLIRKIKPDILHAHYVADNGFRGALSGFHPLVISAWGSDVLIAPKTSKISKWAIRFAVKRADLIICLGENLVKTVEELGANPARVRVNLMGVDTEKFAPLAGDTSLRKKELGLFDSPIIISTRKLKPVYNVETLIKAIPLVLEKAIDAKFVIVGSGPEEDYLKGLAKSLGVLDSTKFLGQIAHDELPSYLVSADIYVSTSLSDSGPVSTLEAMACELPVVVTDSGQHRNWIKDGVNGFIVPMKSPEELASKIIHLLNSKNDRIKFGKANRRVVEQKAYHEKELEKLEKLYEEVEAGCSRTSNHGQ